MIPWVENHPSAFSASADIGALVARRRRASQAGEPEYFCQVTAKGISHPGFGESGSADGLDKSLAQLCIDVAVEDHAFLELNLNKAGLPSEGRTLAEAGDIARAFPKKTPSETGVGPRARVFWPQASPGVDRAPRRRRRQQEGQVAQAAL